MKPNLFRYVHRIIFLLVGCPLLFLSSVTSVHGGGGITISDVAPVGRVAAFTRPIVWVGAGAPTSDDTSALAAAFLVWFNQGGSGSGATVPDLHGHDGRLDADAP